MGEQGSGIVDEVIDLVGAESTGRDQGGDAVQSRHEQQLKAVRVLQP